MKLSRTFWKIPNFLHEPSRRRLSRNFSLGNISLWPPDEVGVNRNWYTVKGGDKSVGRAYKIRFVVVKNVQQQRLI